MTENINNSVQNTESNQNDFAETKAPAAEYTETISFEEDLVIIAEPEIEIPEISVADTFHEEIASVLQNENVPLTNNNLRDANYSAEINFPQNNGLFSETQLFFGNTAFILYAALSFLVILLIISLAVNLRKKLRIKAMDCVIQAEERFKQKKKFGKIKRIYAVNSFIKLIPALLRPFLNVKFSEKMIDSQFREMNKFVRLKTAEEPFFKELGTAPRENINEPFKIKDEKTAGVKINEDDGKNRLNSNQAAPQTINLVIEYPNGIYVKEFEDGEEKNCDNLGTNKNENSYIFKRSSGQKGKGKIWITIF